MIWFNGFPFLDNKEEHSFGVPVSKVMTTHITALPALGMSGQDLEKTLAENAYQGFPIVEDATSKTLIGYIGKTEIRYGLDRQKRDMGLSPHAECQFSLNTATATANVTPFTPTAPDVLYREERLSTGEPPVIDFSRFTNHTPITVHPSLPLETVMELFKKLGPRVILVEHHGKLIGLVTVKDCLKYQFSAEAHVHPKDDARHQVQQERLWGLIKSTAMLVRRKIAHWSKGRIMLGEPDVGNRSSQYPPPGLSEAHYRTPESRRSGAPHDSDPSVELQDRFGLGGTGSG